MGGSLPFRSGVVVSLRPLSVCHGSLWLVTALFACLSLSLPVPIFSWLLLLLRQVPWVCCLTFPVVVRTLAVGPGVFLCFLPALRPPLGSWYTGSCGFSSPLGFPTFAMGSPLRGRGLFVLDRNEGLVSPFGSGALDSSWLALQPLSAGFCAPCFSGSVARWSSLCPYPSVILSSLQGSSLSLVGGSVLPPRPLLGVWGCLSYPTLFSAGCGWCLGR